MVHHKWPAVITFLRLDARLSIPLPNPRYSLRMGYINHQTLTRSPKLLLGDLTITIWPISGDFARLFFHGPRSLESRNMTSMLNATHEDQSVKQKWTYSIHGTSMVRFGGRYIPPCFLGWTNFNSVRGGRAHGILRYILANLQVGIWYTNGQIAQSRRNPSADILKARKLLENLGNCL
jgi:hypothetical protein